LPYDEKVKGSNQVTAAVTNMENNGKACPFLADNGNTTVEHSPFDQRAKGSNLETAPGNGSENHQE
jgi:hypothetical protein